MQFAQIRALIFCYQVGIEGRRWGLPTGTEETTARSRLVAALGLSEDAVTDAPPVSERENVLGEFYRSEKAWLIDLAKVAALTKSPSPTRALRLLVRAAIANRDLLPHAVPISPEPAWLAKVKPLPERLAGWLDTLPDETVEALQAAIKSDLARRKKAKG